MQIFRNFWILLIGAGMLISFISCEGDDNTAGLDVNGDVEISSLRINGMEAQIDNTEDQIELELPYGTDLSGLDVTIDLPEDAHIVPPLNEELDFSGPIRLKVENGNIFKEYTLNVEVQNPILSFTIGKDKGEIDNSRKTITVTVPEGTLLDTIAPIIELAPDVTIRPESGEHLDFSEPVSYTVSGQNKSEEYTAFVTLQVDGPKVAYLGLSSSKEAIQNPDEKSAVDWLFDTFKGGAYVSFDAIKNGMDLEQYDVLWWHYDSDSSLPQEAVNNEVITSIKGFINGGGRILLTSFASQYVEPLGIVPSGKGPNNVFGDFLPDGGVDDANWGMSFKGHENHPIFEGLETYEDGKTYLLEKGNYRLNHVAWWFLPEWGGYDDGEGWRAQTGGINLASEDWDDTLDGRVAIAEFPGDNEPKNCVVISLGAYDWYNENEEISSTQNNKFLGNIQKITANSLNYLSEQ